MRLTSLQPHTLPQSVQQHFPHAWTRRVDIRRQLNMSTIARRIFIKRIVEKSFIAFPLVHRLLYL
jgi:hypothetical protein